MFPAALVASHSSSRLARQRGRVLRTVRFRRLVLEALEDRRLLAYEADRFEPNDTLSAAADVGVGPGVHLPGLTIDEVGDADWYAFELLRNGDLRVDAGFVAAQGALEMELTDLAGSVLATGLAGAGGVTTVADDLPAGSYRIHVWGAAGVTNEYSLAIEPAAAGSSRMFYVNDASTANDFYTLAPGSDANDGLTPSTPKATVQDVLADYDLGPNDLVAIDTGTYGGSTVSITASDEAAAYAGTPAGSNFNYSGTRFDLTDADFNLIYGLRFTGTGGTGVYIRPGTVDPSVNNTMLANTFTGTDTAVRIQGGSANLIQQNIISGSGGYGVRISSGGEATVRGNVISGRTYGIYQDSTSFLLVDGKNDISAASYGIYRTNTAGILTASDNEIHHNATGIYSNNSQATVCANRIHDNTTGIDGYGTFGGTDWSPDQPNEIYANSTGIFSRGGSSIAFNRVYGNLVGIKATGAATVQHNVMYRNTGQALLVEGGQGVLAENNTIYTPSGDAVRIVNASQNVTLRNNILWTDDGYDIFVATNSQQGFTSDYNNLYTASPGAGKLVWFQKDFTDLFDWQVEAGYDSHSIGYTVPHPTLDNPLFIDPAEGVDNYRLAAGSTSIDAGDPASLFSREPGPDGGRINLGAYGDTAEAAQSPTQYIEVDYPNYYTDWPATEGRAIQWHSYDAATGDNLLAGNVYLDLYEEGVGYVGRIAEVPAADGSYGWSPENSDIAADNTSRYEVKITWKNDAGVFDRSREVFSVPAQAGGAYYVNDTALAGDEYSTAAGNNRNPGTTPAAPKANLLPLLRSYDLGPGNVVHIDTGDYIHVRNVIISGNPSLGNDEGARFQGAVNHITRIDRANPYAGSSNIELNDGDYVTLRNLTLTGAYQGLWVRNGSTNFTGEHLAVSDNAQDGIRIESDAEASVVDSLTAFDNGGYGIYITTPISRLSHSVAHHNSTGIYVSNSVSGTLTVVGDEDLSRGGNRVYDNSYRGIAAIGNVRVIGNTVYGHSGSGDAAIWLEKTASAFRNVVYGNEYGIATRDDNYAAANIEQNRVYQNQTGISLKRTSSARGNTVYSNVRGIQAAGGYDGFRGGITNNLVYANTAQGITVSSGRTGAQIVNNTVYQLAGDAVDVESSSEYVKLRNNILWVHAGFAVDVASDSQKGFGGDYNDLITTGGGQIGFWQGAARPALADWQNAAFTDQNSIAQDPRFVDIDGPDGVLGGDHGADDDFHLQSSATDGLSPGSYHGGSLAPVLDPATGLPVMRPGVWTVDTLHSPAIDRGHASDDSSHEPAPNGGYINLGAYGNTDQASTSPAQYVMVTLPDGGQVWPAEQTFPIRWRSHDGLGLVDIVLVRDGDPAFSEIIADDTDNDGEYLWTIPATLVPGSDYRVQITRQDGPSDASNQTFEITEPVLLYYVNDATVEPDDWCTAPGSDASDGLSPATPKASLRAILEAYDLGSGHTILVDNGTYNLSANITITDNDSGVLIRGYDEPVVKPEGRAVLDRGNTASGSYAIQLSGADGVTLECLWITGALYGIYASYSAGSERLTLRNNTVYGNSQSGIYVATPQTVVSQNHVYGNELGIYASGADLSEATKIIIRENTVHANNSVGIDARAYTLAIGNRVSGHSRAGACGIRVDYSATAAENTVYGNYNGIIVGSGDGRGIIRENRVYQNQNIGVLTYLDSTVERNTVYGNSVGIRGEYKFSPGPTGRFSGEIKNNLVYGNTNDGVSVDSGDGAELVNNTIYQPVGDAVRVEGDSEDVRLRSNILWADAGYAINVADDSQVGFSSDYNTLYTNGTGKAGLWQGLEYADLADWFYELGLDQHSSNADPQFIDIDGTDDMLDFRLRDTSPAIDAGDVAGYYLAEPSPNGGRANQGAYGNTAEATTSRGQLVQVLSPNGREKFEEGQAVDIQWRSAGFTLDRTVTLINTGGSTVDNWLSNAYWSGGSTGSFTSAVDTSGVTDPAPAAVYQAYAYASSGVGNRLGYQLPVPDGDYTVQLHFAEPSYTTTGSRVFDVRLQGAVVQSNYDIRAAGGARYKATTLTFPVTTAAGGGISLELVNKTSAGALISAIEVTAANPEGTADPGADLHFSPDGGFTWITIGTNLPMDRFGRGSYAWTAGPLTYTGLIRAVINTWDDTSDDLFLIAGNGMEYYVNDGLLEAEDWTTAPGDNAHSGKSPDAPMASLRALVAAYDLDPGDIVYVDSGTYYVPRNVVLGESDSGVTITGYHDPVFPARCATLNRGNTLRTAFNIEAADDVTLEYLWITGALYGIYASYSAGSERLTLRNNTVYGNSQSGIYVATPQTVVSQNHVYGNELGIYASGADLSEATKIIISENTVHANNSVGIDARAYALALGNRVSGHSRAGACGISVDSNATAAENTVYGNYNGIVVGGNGGRGIIRENHVYRNQNIGILTYLDSPVERNTVYANSVGIRGARFPSNWLTFSGKIANNLVYGNTNYGVSVDYGGGAELVNNTIYQPVGDAVRVEGDSEYVRLRSNILWVDAGYAINVADDSQAGFSSDYNTLYTNGTGKAGLWQGLEFADLTDWFYELGLDQHSSNADPQFIDIDGTDGILDFHLRDTSPAIDAGDPAGYYLAEPSPNGGRVNRGAYGNTAEATTSDDQLVQVLAPNGLEKFEEGQAVDIQWRSAGFTLDRTVALINAGGSTIDNWLSNAYWSGGSTGSFTSAVDTSGVTDPAPAAVYQAYAYASSGVGNRLGYQLPVPDGDYTVRLHFAEPSYTTTGSRVFDVRLQDAVVQSNYDIRAAAGARYKATTLTFPVTTAAGGGISLELFNKTSAGALISAIEVTAADAGGVADPRAGLLFSPDGGSTWIPIGADLPMDRFGRGTYLWTAGPLTDSGLIRATISSVSDTSDGVFLIANDGAAYYINDGAVETGDWTTAPGDNAHSGKSPDAPLASLRALVAAYDLDPGDIVYVDSGVYRVPKNVALGESHSGLTITGYHDPSYPARRATLDRGNGLRTAFNVQGADGVTFDHVSITGAYYGIDAPSSYGSERVTVSQSTFFGNSRSGVRLESPDSRVTASTFYGNAENGISVSGPRSLIDGNDVYGNSTGIYASGSGTAETDRIVVTANTVYDNNVRGIHANTNVVVSENEIYGHSKSSSSEGIYLEWGAAAIGNVVHGNYNGIETYYSSSSNASAWGVVVENRVYSNQSTGIIASWSSIIRGNRVYSNSVGIQVGYFTGEVTNNLVYANTNRGMTVYAGRAGGTLVNNTIYQEVGDALRIEGSSQNVKLRNNILWVEAGYDVYVASDSRSGFDSDNNLFHQGADPAAHVGYWNGVARHSLADWRAALQADASAVGYRESHSRDTDPGFVDINGADNILGYTVAGIGYDGGHDDNFYLSRYSSPIDSAEPWSAPETDIVGRPRRDDPAVPNRGPEYVESDLGTSLFNDTSGTGQGWRSSGYYWTCTFPAGFSFPFYGSTYTSVQVSSEGLLKFAGSMSASDGSNTFEKLRANRLIAPLWDNLRTDRTGDDVFVDKATAGQITIRWNATNEADESDVNFAVVLFADGRIRFDYGSGNTNLTPTIGISRGDGRFWVVSAHDGQAVLTNASSVLFGPAEGESYVDIGAYEFLGSSSDVTPPQLTGTVPAAIEAGGTVWDPMTSLRLTFSETLNPIDAAAPANYELRRAVNGVFGDGDDGVYGLTPSYVFDPLTSSSTTSLDFGLGGAALPADTYRLTVLGREDAALHDLAGNRLDGDRDGNPGPDYARTFRVIDTLVVSQFTPAASGFVAEFNRALELSVLNLYNGAGGTLGPADVVVRDSSGTAVAGSIVADDSRRKISFVATGGPLAPDVYSVTLTSGTAGLRDPTGNLLDGNRDGTAGDDFIISLTVPTSSDRVISIPDWARGAGQPVNVPNAATGLPIRLDNADGVMSLAVDLRYDPGLLVITAAALAAGVPGDWTVVNPPDTSTPGVAKIRASGTTGLSGSNIEVLRLTVAVPNDAPYGASQAIRLENVSLNGGAIGAVGDVAVHKAVYLGDADGSGIHSSADAFLTVQAALGLASGFAAHAWTDPLIVGDADGSGVLSAADAFLIVQEGLGLSEPFVPDNPHITVTPVGGGVDPQFQIDVNVPASAGGLVSVPVRLAIEPAATNVGGFDFDLFFDPARLTIQVPEDVWAGADTAGWAASAILVAPGQLRVGMVSSNGQSLAPGLREIARLQFRVEAGKSSGMGWQPVLRCCDRSPITDYRLPITDLSDESETHPTSLDIEPVDPHAGGYTWTDADGSVLIRCEQHAQAAVTGQRIWHEVDAKADLLESVLADLVHEMASAWR